MKTFEKPDWQKDETCPLCGTTDTKPIVLVPISGTRNGCNAEAIKIHDDCIQRGMWYYPDQKIIVVR